MMSSLLSYLFAAAGPAGNHVYSNFDVMKHTIGQHLFLSTVVSLIVIYFLWYEFKVVHRPRICGGKEGLQEYLLERCPVLSQTYRPTFWAWHYHCMTILRPLLQRCLPISFERQILKLPDGGVVALDWSVSSNCNDSTPILLIMPGLTGDSSLNYVLHFANDGIRQGYRCVVFNQRGMGNLPITTPKIVAASNVEDLVVVLDAIKSQYPRAHIVGLGISLGGIILTQYLNAVGKNSKIIACINFSMPWSIEKSRPTLEGNWINKKLYVNFLLGRMKYIVKRDANVLSQAPGVKINRVLKAKTLTEFDKELTERCYGFKSSEEYYAKCSVHNQLSCIKVPFVVIMSMDDPFAPLDSIPVDEFKSNPYTVLLLTRYGGHFGFIEGCPRGPSWMNKVTRQFLAAMKLKIENL